MHRLVIARNTARALVRPSFNSLRWNGTRNIASLAEDNPFLPNLLAEDGLSKLLTPIEASSSNTPTPTNAEDPVMQKVFAYFTIDRNEVCIKGSFNIKKSSESYDPSQSRFSLSYPSYDPSTPAPQLPHLDKVPHAERVQELANTLWKSFCVNDFLSLKVEGSIHPDGSMSFPNCSAQVDESAVHRQGEIFKHVKRQEHTDELEAEKSLLVYRKIPGGNIGTVVNGAGLAMATNDTIDLLYGKNANFLDAGGKATPETIKEAFRLVLKNQNIKVILVNIFGGVIQGDMIAKGILSAMEALHIHVPVVARIQGTNGALGMKMLAESDFKNIHPEENLYDAVRMAIKLSKDGGKPLTKKERMEGLPKQRQKEVGMRGDE